MELDLTTLMGLFQIRIFYDKVPRQSSTVIGFATTSAGTASHSYDAGSSSPGTGVYVHLSKAVACPQHQWYYPATQGSLL